MCFPAAVSRCGPAVAGGSHDVIGKERLHDCEADLSAAFGEVIAAIVKGCPDGAERREAITEVMRVHRRNFGPC
jgi:hypothetical protein